MSDDLISRQAAIDAIRCDITVTGRQNAELVAATIGSFVDRIKALPSAQPEIVRCKECKYWNPHYAECEGIGNWFGIEGAWSENGYCYKGERLEE